jgi:hypothetical protein
MFENVEVLVDENDFEMYESSKNIIGQIFFKVEDQYFPQNHWTDFIVVVLSWWLEALDVLQDSKINSSNKLMFMDGPYFIKAIKIEKDIVELEFIERDGLLFRSKCSLVDLRNSIRKASLTVIEKMEEKKWSFTDVKRLKLLAKST